MGATLLDFAMANDAAGATPSKLKKQAILADYFRALDDTDLKLAVRFAAGRPFAATDERVLNVGGRAVSDVLLDVLKLDPGHYHDLVVRSGEIGEALTAVWPADGPGGAQGEVHRLLLADLALAFGELAAVGQAQAKREILTSLFVRCIHPREATYAAKIIFGDLRTGVKEGVLQGAIAAAFDTTLDEVQRCQLLVGDLDEVAALAKHKAMGSARFRLFHPIQFMLATPQETAAEAAATLAGRSFYADDKLDGIRAQVHKSGPRIAIYTRTMDRADASFPEVVDAIAKLPGDFLLDGEIVPWHDGSVLPFAHIQKRLGRKTLTPRVLRENPTAFIAFDILYREGAILMEEPLRLRRAALQSLATGPQGSALLIAPATLISSEEQITAAFHAARSRRNEGIVLKDPESNYSPGRRGQSWLKLKTRLPTFDCVVTAAEYGHGKRRSVLSDYTFAVWDRDPSEVGAALVNIGKAYSGLTDEEIAELTQLFLSLSRAQHGRVHLVEPKVVLEIACDQIQRSARHASGYALRFPRIARIRWDKRPEDADRLGRIAEIHESVPNFAYRVGGSAIAPAMDEPTLFDGFP